jgi:hypothetical protein
MPDEQKNEAEQNKGPWAQKAAEIDEKRWLSYQTYGGVVLGIATGAIMFLVKDEGSFLPLNFVLALVIAKFLPDYLEKQMSRSLRRARIVMVIVIAVSILAYAGYILLTKGPSAFIAKQ